MNKTRATRALGWTVVIFAGIIGVVLIIVQAPWLAILGGLIGMWYCSYRSLENGIAKVFKTEQPDED